MRFDNFFRATAILFLACGLFASHAGSATAQTPLKSETSSFQLDEPGFRGLDANLYMQTSAEYRAACYQAYQLASLRLRQALAALPAPNQKLAVVMDLDETVFDNSGFQSWLLRSGQAYNQPLFDRWEQFGGASVGLIPGAKEFILDIQAAGVTVVHISNRNESFRPFTKQTLARLGIPINDDSQLKLSTDTSNKTTRRAEVENKDGLTVLLSIGDNLRDFDERFKSPPLTDASNSTDIDNAINFRKSQVDATRANWGSKWIVLPNPAYGEWTKPLGRGETDLDRLGHGGTKIGLAFWNVENLFDLMDDPTVRGDEEFTPAGPNAWTSERLEIKLNNLATVIALMHNGRGPDLLGLAEIENRDVVAMLVAKLKPLGRDYQIVHQDSPSERGIDTAMIYDAQVFKLMQAKFHHVAAENTRDILEAALMIDGSPLTVFVNHWPSRGHEPSFRIKAAQTLRTRIDQLLANNALADVVAMGDFNDHPTDESIVTALNTTGQLSALSGGKLLNSSFDATPDATTGTYVYDEQWEILDQIFLSPGLLVPGGVSWGIGSTHPVILAADQLYDPSGDAIPRPSRSYSKTTFHKQGYSDHLPVVTTIYYEMDVRNGLE